MEIEGRLVLSFGGKGLRRKHRESVGMMAIFYILRWVVVMCDYICRNTSKCALKIGFVRVSLSQPPIKIFYMEKIMIPKRTILVD